jgi:hypothetical protein
MRIKGHLYPHQYPPLIDKALFDVCQKNRKRAKTPQQAIRKTRKAYALRGLVTCAVSGRKVTCVMEKGRYPYLMARDPKNPAKKLWVPEQDVLNQARAVFQRISIPDDTLSAMLDYIRASHEAEKAYHHDHIHELQIESNNLTGKLDRLTDLLLEGHVMQEVYDRKASEVLQRQQQIARELGHGHEADARFKTALSGLVKLAAKTKNLFESSKTEEKRQLIGIVFSNLQLEGSTLRYTLRKPFDLFVDLASIPEWRPIQDESGYWNLALKLDSLRPSAPSPSSKKLKRHELE